MAKNDVEFSIGADNAPLKSDLQETEELLTSVEKKTDDIGDSTEGLVGKWSRIAGLIGLAVTAFTTVVTLAREWYGLNEGIEKQLEQQDAIREGRLRNIDANLDRAKQLRTIEEQIAAVEARRAEVQKNISTQELRKTQARKDLEESFQEFPGVGRAAEFVGLENLQKTLDEVDKELENTQEQAKVLDKELLQLNRAQDKLNESFNRELEILKLQKDALEGKATAELEIANIRQQNSKYTQEQLDQLDAARRLLEIAKLQKQIDAEKESQLKRLASLDERRQRIIDKQNTPAGGIDRGLLSIGNRLAEAASKPNPTLKQIEKINKDQLDQQIKFNENLTDLTDAIDDINLGMNK